MSDNPTPDIEQRIASLPRLPVPERSSGDPAAPEKKTTARDLQRRLLEMAGLRPQAIIQRLRERFGEK